MKLFVLVLVMCANVALAQDIKDTKISIGIQMTTTAQAKKELDDDKSAKKSNFTTQMPSTGLLIVSATEDGGWAAAGGEVRDVIMTIDGIVMDDIQKISEWVANAKVGETYVFVVQRYDAKKGKWERVSIKLQGTPPRAVPPKAKAGWVGPSESLFVFDVANGQLGIHVDSPVVYISKNGNRHTQYQSVFHCFRDANRKVHQSKEGFYPLKDGATEIKLSSDTPDVLEVTRNPELGIGNDLTFKKDGEGRIKIDFAGKSFIIPIKVIRLDFSEGGEGADVIRAIGLPDKEKSYSVRWPNTESYDKIIYSPKAGDSANAKHWKYEKYPYLTISIMNGKVHRLSSYRHDGTIEYIEWMENHKLNLLDSGKPSR